MTCQIKVETGNIILITLMLLKRRSCIHISTWNSWYFKNSFTSTLLMIESKPNLIIGSIFLHPGHRRLLGLTQWNNNYVVVKHNAISKELEYPSFPRWLGAVGFSIMKISLIWPSICVWSRFKNFHIINMSNAALFRLKTSAPFLVFCKKEEVNF